MVAIFLASIDLYSSRILAETVPSCAPATIRSGFMKSARAVPSLRNSGFDATWTSLRFRACFTLSPEPTGTVDFKTTIESGAAIFAKSCATDKTKDKLAAPLAS